MGNNNANYHSTQKGIWAANRTIATCTMPVKSTLEAKDS